MLELIDGRAQLAPVHIPRPTSPAGAPEYLDIARSIVEDVRARGDAALLDHTERLDGVRLAPGELRVEPETIRQALRSVRPELVAALKFLAARVRASCERQAPEEWLDESPDELIGELIRPLRRAGIYAPGGRAPYPSSVIMAAVPAQVVGVGGLAVASPPRRGGDIAEVVLAACAVAGVDEVYRMGGAQAIAAFAYGTESVRPVEKIVGPGNVFVTMAKRLVQGWVGIDSEAGPTEIAIVADAGADPAILAADLVAQAEHGPHGSHVLITWVPELVDAVIAALESQVYSHARPDDLENALIEGGAAVLVRDLTHALDTANAFAPEHLQLDFDGAEASLERVHKAGAVFVGPYSPVPAGDYVAGTNHVLPTGGSARWASGLGVGDFLTRIYVARLSESALARYAPHIDALAEAEGLPGHARAVRMRLDRAGAAGL